ncbi:MAG: sigma-54 dependent transcriptional regulator [Pseudomonadota bacterium]
MPAKQATVLIVEDVVSLAMTYRSYLKAENVAVEVVGDGQAALDAVANNPPNAIVLDINLPDISGMDILQTLREKGLDIPVIMITGDGSVQTAVETMRRGAFDFIVKPFTADRLRVTLRNALTQHKLKEQVNELRQNFAAEGFGEFIGNSLTMQSVYQILRSAAQSNATVFVTGESGTGKELCAEALHKMSKRADKPLVAINCASIPPGLLESEIFGHVKGSFTGATTDRLGAVLSADGGTLFLDEIGEMQPEFQSKLLRFLETGQVQRVGEDKLRKSNVRIVCATNRDPRHEVAEGRFREDLFYRLHVIPVEMPPLRERETDSLMLANHFLQMFAKEDGKPLEGFTEAAEDAILTYTWPGNIRELKNAVRNAVVLGEGPVIDVGDLPIDLHRQANAAPAATQDPGVRLMQPTSHAGVSSQVVPLEQQIDIAIQRAINAMDGSIPKAAAALKVSPSTIYRRLQSRSHKDSA